MMPTLMQRITLVKLYYKNGRDFSATINAYGDDFGEHSIITVKALRSLIAKFEITGSVEDYRSRAICNG